MLLKFKGEFQKKSDFMFEKLKETSDEVHKTMDKINKEFKEVKEPIVNKINDIN